MPASPTPELKRKTIGLILISALSIPALVFLPAQTLDYWQGWAFAAVALVQPVGTALYFYKRDPEALARRLLRREKLGVQRIIIFLVKLLYVGGLALAGLDFCAGWTRARFGVMPWWLSVAALAVLVASHLWFIYVLRANPFGAAIIHTESNQTICAAGPYRLIRHPMYSGMILGWLATPLALGSLVALPVFALIIPIFAWRLLNEETFLRRELPGYADYCRQTPYRLIPYIW